MRPEIRVRMTSRTHVVRLWSTGSAWSTRRLSSLRSLRERLLDRRNRCHPILCIHCHPQFGEDRFGQGLSAHPLTHPGFLRGDPPHTVFFIADSVEGYLQCPASAGMPEAKRLGSEVSMDFIFKQTFTQ